MVPFLIVYVHMFIYMNNEVDRRDVETSMCSFQDFIRVIVSDWNFP